MPSTFYKHFTMERNYKSNRAKTGRFTNMWNLNNTLLNNQRGKEEITREIRKHFEMDKNENTTYQNLWDAVKAVLRIL